MDYRHNHLVLQYMLQQQTNNVAKNLKPMKRWAWQESPNYSNTIVTVAIEGLSIATKYRSWQQRVQVWQLSIDRGNRDCPFSNQIFVVAIEGSTYSNHRDSVAIERPPVATKYLSSQQRVPAIATTKIVWQQMVHLLQCY